MPRTKACGGPPFAELEGVDELSLSVFRALTRAMHLQRQHVNRTLSRTGTHFGHVACLKILAGHDGIPQRDLAEFLHLSRPSVTGVVQTLEKDGFVQRRADERDQRLTRVYLTDAGRAEERRQRLVLAGFVNETVGRMPEKDRRDLARLLDEMNDYSAEALKDSSAEEGADQAR